MTFSSRMGDLLWGTPLYSVGNRLFERAVEVYLRTNPTCDVTCAGTTARFRPQTFVEWNNLRHRIWDEATVLEHLLSNVRSTDVFYDVGANVGIYSCLVGVREPDATIVGFEPYRPNADSLRRNLRANDIDATVVERPLSNETKDADFHVYDTLDAGAQHGSLDTDYPSGDVLASLSMEAVSGDELVECGYLPAPTMLKIDVQGTGPDVLSGLETSLTASRCRLVYVETHDNRDDITSMLSSYGFETSHLRVDRENKAPTVVGRRRTDDGGALNQPDSHK